MDEPSVEIILGTAFEARGASWRVSRKLSLDRIFAEAPDTGDGRIFTVGEVSEALSRGAAAAPRTGPWKDLVTVPDEDWAVAQRRFAFVERLARKEGRTRQDVEAAAKVAGVHTATLYEWIAAYEDAGRVSGLLPRKPGRRRGSTRLDPAMEDLIARTIKDLYLHKQRHIAQKVVDEVVMASKRAGLKPPSPGSVRARIAAWDPGASLRARGRKDLAQSKLEPIRGSFPDQGAPLSVVQIDHTPLDIVVVDEVLRKPMGRPWITVAICTHTRMIAGISLSMEHPGAFAVGLCLYNAIAPKRAYLASLDVPGEWPVQGFMSVIHTDNAKEFRGEMLARACREHGMNIEFRPGRQPRYGGHIERLIGTTMRVVHGLPGTTMSNAQMRKGYDSDKMAALTLPELEKYIVDWIVNKYHAEIHSALKMTPLRKWRIGVEGDADRPGIGVARIPGDLDRLRLDFLPFEMRTIQPYGVLIDGVHWWDEVLKTKLTLGKKRKHVFRYDPRDMSVIHFFDPETSTYYDVPYRDMSRPAASLWEIRNANKVLKEEGRKHYDEQAIFDTIERLRLRVEDAVRRTKDARKDAHRAKTAEKVARKRKEIAGKPIDVSAPPRKAAPTLTGRTFDEALFAEPVMPFANSGSLHRPRPDEEE